ncbi:MAG: endonuclease III [Peptococcaceae bacterium]|jgi:endonuclease-3|nr:endonuclease III [Peptococcaceae bacterium]
MLDKKTAGEVFKVLEAQYGGIGTALNYETPFQLLIATMLSAQTTDVQVNRMTPKLFADYPDARSMEKLTAEELSEYIKGCGLYRGKAKHILAAVSILTAKYQGQVPESLEELTALPGVGRKTANVVLSNAFGQPALAVDTHVLRVSNRLGLARGKDPLKVEEQLCGRLPREVWGQAHHWLIWHGRRICKAQKPLCGECALRELCPERNSNPESGKAPGEGGAGALTDSAF